MEHSLSEASEHEGRKRRTTPGTHDDGIGPKVAGCFDDLMGNPTRLGRSDLNGDGHPDLLEPVRHLVQDLADFALLFSFQQVVGKPQDYLLDVKDEDCCARQASQVKGYRVKGPGPLAPPEAVSGRRGNRACRGLPPRSKPWRPWDLDTCTLAGDAWGRAI